MAGQAFAVGRASWERDIDGWNGKVTSKENGMTCRAYRPKTLLASMALVLSLHAAALAQPSPANRLAPSQPGTDIYILSFGLWGSQSVFESEAKGAARMLEASLNTKDRTI